MPGRMHARFANPAWRAALMLQARWWLCADNGSLGQGATRGYMLRAVLCTRRPFAACPKNAHEGSSNRR
jgi:hypothetical protein